MLIKKIKFFDRKMLLYRDEASSIEVKYFEYPNLREKLARFVISFAEAIFLEEDKTGDLENIFNIVERIEYIEAENNNLEVKFKTGKAFSCQIHETLKEEYYHIRSYIDEYDFPENKLEYSIQELKNLLQYAREEELLRKSLKDNIDNLLKMLKNIWEAGIIYPEDMDELWASLLDIRTELFRNKKKLYENEDFIIKHITIKNDLIVNMNNATHNIPHNDDIITGINSLKQSLIKLIRKDYLRVLDNKNFECRICGECCKTFIIEIEPSDIKRLYEAPGIWKEQLETEYLETVRYSWNNGSKILKKFLNGNTGREECVFLKYNGKGKYYCSVHRFKPFLCRRYKAGKPHCYKNSNYEEFDFKNINIDGENIFIQTEYTDERMKYPFLIQWRRNDILKKEIEQLTNLVIIWMKKNHGR